MYFRDTAGQERFHTFTTNFFRGAHGFVLVYDITDAKSFQGISHWMKDIYEVSFCSSGHKIHYIINRFREAIQTTRFLYVLFKHFWSKATPS